MKHRTEQIGDHTLYLGDCLEVMGGLEPVDAVVTDPPYNAGKDYGTASDDLSEEDYSGFMIRVIEECKRIAKHQFWVAPRYKMNLFLGLLPDSHIIVIPRGASGPFRQGWSDQFETALAVGKPYGAPSDLWKGIRLKGEGYFFRENTFGHPGYTPYPIMGKAVECMSRESVLDPFMGSGTTGVACANLGRKFIGIEIEEKFFDIACRRIEQAAAQTRMEFDRPKPVQLAME